ncbi:MAG: energy-coupling factor transporter transmembrane protein EcfT [Dethiobacter sp.]|nr:MAG: energy-coupling factor transporter transmembrane protein EcfT [Dethiobacter sp.]
MDFFAETRPANFLQELNPLVKLLVSMLIFIYCLSSARLWPLLIMFLLLLVFLLASGLGRAVLKVLPFGLLIGTSVLAISLLLGSSREGALVSLLRIHYLFISFLLFSATTSPAAFMSALNQLKMPSSLSLGLVIVMRFLPVLSQEMEKIYQSFALRTGNKKKKLSLTYRGIMVPFIFRLFTLSDNLTLALQMRAFESRPALSSYGKVAVKPGDWLFLGIIMALMGVIRWRF